ncbi:MAG: hypothetical protein ABJC05_00390 [Pyrinomonadaceae bacterium]
MSIGPLKRRSSWPSSFVTGLIGWIGFFIIVGAVLGQGRHAGKLFVLGSIAAVAQIVFLRLFFSILRLNRSQLAAAFWGGLTGAAIVLAEMRVTPEFNAHPVIWLVNGIYIGVPVGLFLWYFYRDDRRIEQAAEEKGQSVDYGRDAHWLEPFAFGAVAYLIAFIPTSFDLAVNILVVGAISGVLAAGVSHFFLFSVARTSILPLVMSVVAGAVQGSLTGLLFRPFTGELIFSPLAHGAVAGVLTYAMTALRGRALASGEFAAKD